jgi:hypothetical protein
MPLIIRVNKLLGIYLGTLRPLSACISETGDHPHLAQGDISTTCTTGSNAVALPFSRLTLSSNRWTGTKKSLFSCTAVRTSSTSVQTRRKAALQAVFCLLGSRTLEPDGLCFSCEAVACTFMIPAAYRASRREVVRICGVLWWLCIRKVNRNKGDTLPAL